MRTLGLALLGLALAGACAAWVLSRGLAVTGDGQSVVWGADAVTFAWWLGIAQAGTLTSALLFLFDQPWRAGLHRLAEAMTLAAVALALAHLAVFEGLGPTLWWQLDSARARDVLALVGYGVASLSFSYVGLVPTLAALRDRSPSRRVRITCGILALGWRGSGRHWNHHQLGHRLLAALCVPLALFVGPPAPLAGLAVLTLLLLARSADVDRPNRLVLAAALLFLVGQAVEQFIAWYGGPASAHGPLFWTSLALAGAAPQLFWSKRLRTHPLAAAWVATAVLSGTWLERYVAIVLPQQRGHLPSSFSAYAPTWVDAGALLGSLLVFYAALRLVPAPKGAPA